jgi:guanine nucleotide-binding protein G(i) subunit alpha
LWEDAKIQETYSQRNTFQIIESAQYFIEKVDQVLVDSYCPSLEDVVHAVVRTTGLLDGGITVGSNNFKIYDTGGQRNERKKWIHCFEGATGMIFIAALREYDQCLFEDNSINRMTESLNLFEEMSLSKWFEEKPIFLLLSKRDVLEKKLSKSPLSTLFPEYIGGDSPELAMDFIRDQFLKRAPVSAQDRIHLYRQKQCEVCI